MKTTTLLDDDMNSRYHYRAAITVMTIISIFMAMALFCFVVGLSQMLREMSGLASELRIPSIFAAGRPAPSNLSF